MFTNNLQSRLGDTTLPFGLLSQVFGSARVLSCRMSDEISIEMICWVHLGTSWRLFSQIFRSISIMFCLHVDATKNLICRGTCESSSTIKIKELFQDSSSKAPQVPLLQVPIFRFYVPLQGFKFQSSPHGALGHAPVGLGEIMSFKGDNINGADPGLRFDRFSPAVTGGKRLGSL